MSHSLELRAMTHSKPITGKGNRISTIPLAWTNQDLHSWGWGFLHILWANRESKHRNSSLSLWEAEVGGRSICWGIQQCLLWALSGTKDIGIKIYYRHKNIHREEKLLIRDLLVSSFPQIPAPDIPPQALSILKVIKSKTFYLWERSDWRDYDTPFTFIAIRAAHWGISLGKVYFSLGGGKFQLFQN